MILSETSYNLPLYWAGTETMGFQGQDIDNFIYQYYLTGDRWVHETVQRFGQYLIDTFDPRTTKPAGDMYNYQPYMFLASLYEMTWDERLGDQLRAMRWTLDPDTTTGLMNWPTYGAWYKWYIELFGPLRDYQVTGSQQARDAFLKLAHLYITHAPAGRHLNGDMGYDDNYGLAMNLAWQLTGDERFAAHGREMLSRRLFWFSAESGESHRVGPFVAAHSPQGLDSYAYLMDLVAHMPADTPRYPALEVGADSPPVEVYLVKAPGAATHLAGVGGGNFDVNLARLLDRKDARNRLGLFKITQWPRYAVNDPQAGLHDRDRYLELLLPREMAPGQYRLQDVREVSWTNARQLVVAAPQGLAIPAASATPASWYFRIPAGKRGALYVDQPVLLERHGKSETVAPDTWCELVGGPEDEVVKLTPARSDFDPLPFQPGRGYTVLSRIVKGTILVQLRGDIPPVLTPHDPGRLFLPDLIAPAAAPAPPARKADVETDD